MRSNILVTGAGGFLGSWITEALHLSRAARVRAGVHRWGSAVRVARFPLEIVHCDVLSIDTIRAALHGMDAVVHCAISSDPSVVTEGTKNVLEAAASCSTVR